MAKETGISIKVSKAERRVAELLARGLRRQARSELNLSCAQRADLTLLPGHCASSLPLPLSSCLPPSLFNNYHTRQAVPYMILVAAMVVFQKA